MPIPFHCHECDKPTMNKNGLCDEHQPEVKIKYIEPIDFYPNPSTITLNDLSQKK